jgi:hypothetical protein
MTAASSAISAATPRSWVTKMTASPSRCWRSRSSQRIRHVERRGRLVGEQQLRLAGQRDRDHRALAHAAGDLVRIARQAPLGRRHLDEIEELARAPGRGAAIQVAVLHERLDDLAADRVDGVEGGHRLLEHQGDDPTPQALAGALVEAVHVTPLHEHLAGDPGSHGRMEAENRAEGDALAGARFAEEGEDLPGFEREGHVVHRTHDTVTRFERDAQIADTQE